MSLADPWGWLVVEGTILASFLIVLLFLRRTQKGTLRRRVKPRPGEKAGRKSGKDEPAAEGIGVSLSRPFPNPGGEAGAGQEFSRILGREDSKFDSAFAEDRGEDPCFPSEAGVQDGNRQILEMATAGCGVGDIAKRLGLSQEEVQLILDLRKITASG